MSALRKIGLFGGTFDPVHLGHIHLATLAKEALQLDEVRFLPCRISPHKTGTAPASGEDRCEMLRIATADLPWAVVDDFELTQIDPSFSYLTAEAMAGKFRDARLFWIMGGDQWDALPRWKNPERLAARVEFIVLARGETPPPRDGYRLHVVQGQHPASATAIREAVSNGLTEIHFLDPAVAKWIEEKGLYRQDLSSSPASSDPPRSTE
ncbi:MAG: nicotinate (nicotinamide) nucleotide adenylyltransferase [Verrucomicrobiota bacterium]